VNAEQLEILIQSDRGLVKPGGFVRGGFRVLTEAPLPVERVELSVVWQTSGRGDADESVVHLEAMAEGETLTAERAFPFQVQLPDRPWSYSGQLIKISWTVRVRVFPVDGASWGGAEEFRVHPAGWEEKGAGSE
jgi:hypothetical protein